MVQQGQSWGFTSQQPRSYWDNSSALSLVGVKPTQRGQTVIFTRLTNHLATDSHRLAKTEYLQNVSQSNKQPFIVNNVQKMLFLLMALLLTTPESIIVYCGKYCD